MKNAVIFIPDTKESRLALDYLLDHSVPTIIVGKKKWLTSRDYRDSIGIVEIDSIDLSSTFDEGLTKGKEWASVCFKTLCNDISSIMTNSGICSDNIFGVFSFTEGRVYLAAALREWLQIPGMNTHDVQKFRNKLVMRQYAKEHGIRVPLFCDPYELSQRVLFYENLKRPRLILKKTSAWACIGTRIFNSPSELDRYFENNPPKKGEWILEEFIDGEMMSIGGTIANGQIIQETPVRYQTPAIFKGQPNHPHVVFFTMPHSDEDAATLSNFHSTIVKKFALDWVMTDVEVIKCSTTGDLHLCEVAARHTSHRILKLHELVHHVCPALTFARAIASECKQDPSLFLYPIKSDDIHGGIIGFLSPEGTVKDATSLKTFTDDEIVFYEEFDILGNHFPTRSVNNLFGFLMVASSTESRCKQLINQYADNFVVCMA